MNLKNRKKEFFVMWIISFLLADVYFILKNLLVKDIFIISHTSIRYILFNIASLVIVNLIIFFILYFCRNRAKHKSFIKNFIVVFCILLIALIILWPGIFKGDEYYILRQSVKMQICYEQHYITSLFYILSLLIFPTPGSITFFQILLISCILAYIFSNVQRYLKNKKNVYLFVLLLFLPAVIDNNFFTLRSSLISYFFLLSIFYLLFYSRDNKYKYLLYSILSSALIGAWKSELVYVPILIVVYIFLFYYRTLGVKKIISLIIILGLIYNSLIYFQKDNSNYKLTAVINPLTVMLKSNKVINTLSVEDKQKLEHVISIKNMRQYADYQNIGIYFMMVKNNNYSDKQRKDYMITYFKTVLKNPKEFLDARLKTFSATSLSHSYERPNHTGNEYPAAQWESNHIWYFRFSDVFGFTNGILNSQQKKMIICLLLMRHNDDYMPNIFNHLFYNIIPIVLISIFYSAICFMRKQWKRLFLIMICLIDFALVFLTAPASFWMYYMPLYIVLHFLMLYYFICFLDKQKVISDYK